MVPMEIPDIYKFRAEIDAIDDKIISLLNERSAIVKNVGIAKKNTLQENICFIRSGREASLIRRIYKEFGGGVFPAIASTQIWRIIICASLSLESRLNISAFGSGVDNRIYWLAREYFGNFMPVSLNSSSTDIINDVKNNNMQVAVLPVNGKWWATLPEDIKIFACVPFVLKENEQIEALAVARLEPEKTGDDVTLLRLTAANITSDIIQDLFATYSIKATLLGSQDNIHLIECQGFIEQDSNILSDIIKKSGFTITQIGAYAAPLVIY